ncbi:MAG TPA: hypothetical protein VMS22_08295 [Candidatus Eisenbacteria bacterium]|nr:hypothetical protein [Candidatus Eisenbacteria bacterium]
MEQHHTHDGHDHPHRAGCGHTEIRHGDHTDYLHDGHLHRVHGDHVDECAVAVGATNPAACTPKHACGGHDASHAHGAGCGHDAIPHAEHTDYVVAGHLHHPHGGHCDDHGAVNVL